MDRRKALATTGMAGLAGILAACGKQDGTASGPAVISGDKIRWRLASSFPKSLDTIFGAAEVFSNSIKEMSGGKFEISVHAAGELMPAFGNLDGVQQGTVEMAHTAAYYFYGKDPTFSLDAAIPFGFNSRQLNAWMYSGNGLSLMREFYANYNVVNFPMGNTGTQMGGWFRKPIKSVKDIKGLKMRIAGFAGKILESLGGVPQQLPGGEIYQALEKGTIDAAEWVGPYDDFKLGFYKVAPFYHYPAWWEGGPQLSLYVNNNAFNGLPKEYQTMITAAASHAHVNMQAMYDQRNPGALKELVANNTKLVEFPKDFMDAAFKSSQDIYADLKKTNPAWNKIYSDFENFRRDQNMWFRFTEARFDSYMQRAKL